MSSEFEILRKPRHPPASLIERILSVIATLGLACFCIGLILFIYGKASNNLTVDLFGGRVLVIGIILVAPKLFFWLVVEIVERA